MAVVGIDSRRSYWAPKITAAWNKTREGIFEVGRLLVGAKSALAEQSGEFTAMFERREVPFGLRTGEMLMEVYHRFAESNYSSILPNSWRTLAYLTKLTDDSFAAAVRDGDIYPDMEQAAAVKLVQAQKDRTRHIPPADGGGVIEDLHAAIAAGRRWGCIYLDPPWPYDNQATRSATRRHYKGTMTLDQLADELPVGQLAAKDAHVHMWTTNGFLFECPRLFAAWGFAFKTTFVWVKPEMGIGNYWRNAHEILLTGVRGDATRFNDKNMQSWVHEPRGKHSVKPLMHDRLRRASPGPYIELFARAVVPEWSVWGDEVQRLGPFFDPQRVARAGGGQ